MAEQTGLRNIVTPTPIYGVPWGFVVPIFDADGDPVTGAASLDTEISKNGDTFADCTNEATEIATSSGFYYLLLTAAEMTTNVAAVRIQTSTSGAKTTPVTLTPKVCPVVRSATATGGAAGYITLDAGASNVDDTYNGLIAYISSGTGSGQVRRITDYTGSNKQAAVTPDWSTNPDNTSVFSLYLYDVWAVQPSNVAQWLGATAPANTGDAYARLGAPAGASVSADVAAVKSDSGAIKTKTDYLPSATAGAAGGVFIAGSNAATSIATALTANITGNLSGSVGSVTGNVGGSVASVGNGGISSSSFGAGAIDATCIAADAIGASQLAASALAEIRAEANGALVDNHLDHLLAADYDPAAKPGVATALLNELVESDAGVSRFTANALEQGPTGTGAGDWTSGEKEQIRQALGVTGTKTATSGGNLDAVKTKTDYLPSATAGAAGGVFIAGSNAATSVTTALTANITGNLSGSVGSVTGAVGSVTGNVGGNVTGSVGSLAAQAKADVNAEVDSALNTAIPGSPVADSINERIATMDGRLLGTVAAGTHTAQTGDAYARLGAPAGASVSADVAAIKAQTAAIETDTQDLQTQVGVDGAGLTAMPWNAAWDAEVQSEVQDAIEANHLDHLLAADYDPAAKPGVATALLNELVESDAGVSRFTANALEQGPVDWDTGERNQIRKALAVTGTQAALDATTGVGVLVAPAGLDSITIPTLTGPATTFPGMLVQLWRRHFKKATMTATQLKTYADDGSTVVTTQTLSDDSTTQTQGAAT